MIEPLAFNWDGEAFVPANGHWARRADKALVVGLTYNLVEHEDRSSASHRHYFAAVKQGWQSLPEHLSERFPTPERLRKYALIKAGFADSQTFVAGSRAEALRLAQFLKPVDEFSVVTVDGAAVTRWTAKSQSQRAMAKADFQRSKDAVLEIIAGMIDVAPAVLADEGRRAA
ncbi:hypothetical protein [uncultured Enterovirga sp.]|uniref:hypothetical protein n=1 Tax=uncultured Enterovirga sp. TaxID=2026352 RepID=UPI0035CC4D20